MATGGVIVSVRDETAIPEFLAGGVFGREIRLGPPDDPNHGPYIRALASYGTCRRNDHVFFQSGDRFVYAGRVRGAETHGAFYLNGRRGFLGRRADAPLVWEGTRGERGRGAGARRASRPFLVRFGDDLGLAGRWIDDHSVYRSLGDYPYLLPTTWSGSDMVSISPGETKRLLSLLVDEPVGEIPSATGIDAGLAADAVPFEPKYGPNLLGAWTTEELTAALLAHPPWATVPAVAGERGHRPPHPDLSLPPERRSDRRHRLVLGPQPSRRHDPGRPALRQRRTGRVRPATPD